MDNLLKKSFYQRINLVLDAGIAHVMLARPEKRNALDAAMFDGLVEVGCYLQDRKDVRVVVISGDGKGFCAGLDLNCMSDAPASSAVAAALNDLPKRTHGYTNLVQHVCCLWRDLPVPVIAAVHGAVYGGGLQIALGADMRFASPESQFSFMEIRWGLVPDMGGTQLIKDLVRPDIAKELIYTGRVFNPDEAARFGVVTEVVADPLGKALDTAKRIASRNPHAIRAAKALLTHGQEVSIGEGLLMEATLQQPILHSPNQREAVAAELEGRAPVFED